MRKIIIVMIAMLAMTRISNASVIDQLYGGFVGRAKLSIETNTDGKNRPEFLVNYVEIGQVNGFPIAAIDAGVLGTILPNNSQFKSASWTLGAKLHLSPLIHSYVKLPAEWQFLGSTLEIDARCSYNISEHHPYYGLVAGVPFK